MANLTRQDVSKSGLNTSFAAASSGGDSFPNDDRTMFVVKNGDAGSHTATIAVQRPTLNIGNLGDITFEAIAVAVPAGEERWVKVPPAAYNDGDGKVHVTYDAVTSVTVAAVRLPPA